MTTTKEQEDLIVAATRGRQARAGEGGAATTAGEVDQQVQAIIDSYEKKLLAATTKYQQQLSELTTQPQAQAGAGEAADVTASFFGITYQFFNLLMLGPFQRAAPLGPFRPSKIIISGERAFMIAALWRNPLPLPGGPNPSAAQIMSPFQFRIRGEVMNLSTVTDGPDFAPVTGTFGGGFINTFQMNVPALPVPTEGNPTLYEANFTVDILGVGTGLPPFAGYSTWLFDPDNEPPFVLPNIFIPGIGTRTIRVPSLGPLLQHDIPARFMVYV